MNINWKKLLLCLAIPLGVGGLAAWLTRGTMDVYATYEKPPLSPPGWIFPVVWTILYLLMGLASYLVLESDGKKQDKTRALTVYAIQLGLNFIWPLVFFRAQELLAAFGILVLLWAAIYLTIRSFSRIRELAGDLLIPYLLWVSFAGYLNLGIYLLNG